jgi:Xaa-Pro dipeptidase
MESLPDSLIVVAGSCKIAAIRRHFSYPFRQDSNFWYLAGINEPGVVLVIDTKKGESTLLIARAKRIPKRMGRRKRNI